MLDDINKEIHSLVNRGRVSFEESAKMKLVFSVIVAVVLIGCCEAQIGGFAASQNCAGGSNCNQNNFGRKRRQILEEILTKVEAEESAREAAKNEAEELARDVAKREAEAQFVGFTASQNCVGSLCNQNNLGQAGAQFGGFTAAQNCVGALCNQNNFGRKKRQIAEMIESLTKEVMEDENLDVEETPLERETREAEAEPQFGSFTASQNCAGSNCNQNNFGSQPQFGNFDAAQNCVGSNCNQNNFGRKKREVIAALLEELL